MSETAQALSMAAPGGPLGIECVDECRCDERAIHDLHQVLMEQSHPATEEHELVKKLLVDLKSALRQDQSKLSSRTLLTQELLRDLAEWRVVVSRHTSRVAHARMAFPTTWSVIHVSSR